MKIDHRVSCVLSSRRRPAPREALPLVVDFLEVYINYCAHSTDSKILRGFYVFLHFASDPDDVMCKYSGQNTSFDLPKHMSTAARATAPL